MEALSSRKTDFYLFSIFRILCVAEIQDTGSGKIHNICSMDFSDLLQRNGKVIFDHPYDNGGIRVTLAFNVVIPVPDAQSGVRAASSLLHYKFKR